MFVIVLKVKNQGVFFWLVFKANTGFYVNEKIEYHCIKKHRLAYSYFSVPVYFAAAPGFLYAQRRVPAGK